jgi:hypothetical protein
MQAGAVLYCTETNRREQSVCTAGSSIQMYQILCHFVLSLFLLSRLVKTEKKKERGQKG